MGLNILDSIIGYFNPQAGYKRAQARTAFDLVRNYEGASKGRRTDGWKTWNGSANAALARQAEILRNRSRDLTRNDPYAAKALMVIVNNTVGSGIVPQAKSGQRGNRARAAMDLWTTWGETVACDADGNMDFYGIQALVLRTVAESGECLIRRIWDKDQAVPLQIRVLEPDYLDSTRDVASTQEGNRIVQGVHYSPTGAVVGYQMYDRHPGDNQIFGRLQSSFVAASEIIHVFRADRPGQGRGVPWPAPIIIRLKDFGDFEDAQLVRQKLAACFMAFVTDSEAGATPPINGQNPSLLVSI